MGETVAPILVHYSQYLNLQICSSRLVESKNLNKYCEFYTIVRDSLINGLHSVQMARLNKGLKSELLTQIAI